MNEEEECLETSCSKTSSPKWFDLKDDLRMLKTIISQNNKAKNIFETVIYTNFRVT